ncbi:ATP-dependent helicase [uncultured Mailhella sp.]|uniref:ATP-dependent helicase n=1 Tax=uncultured Mailhella sp. TaxID=1981031 RepID=UPI0025E4A2BF|nr:ATP-dependent helicase [uncultured Mailhella sp.]
MLDLSILNEAQAQAVTAPEGPMLVIAGAGSGKTRTIVYRLAWLAEHGLDPHAMLLLTFTRKASQEMLHRAAGLLDHQLLGVQGGTFHSFAFSVLRRFSPDWTGGSLTVMDTSDSTAAIQTCKENLKIGKGDRSFPRTQAVLGLLSKARNKEMELEEVLRREAQHLLPHASDLVELGEAYRKYKREHALMDYDDLLFELEQLFIDKPDILQAQKMRFSQIMVDEYQDTNKVQARLVRMLAGEEGNIMAVGDDAQSIYAFRGATVHNILDFPKLFHNTRIIRLEENYRSVQPVLDIANNLLANTTEGYRKHLFSRRPAPSEPAVTLYRPLSDLTQAQLVARRVEELLATVPAREIAVLFRSGYQSYHLELELNKRGIGFRKYGGLRYAEAAHVKDVMAFARLVNNPLDLPSFDRIAALSRGIGPKTSRKLFALAGGGDEAALKKACSRWPDFLENMALINELRMTEPRPEEVIGRILDHYRPKMEELFPDDWPRRLQGLEEMSTIASSYEDLQLFIADISLDSPEEAPEDEDGDQKITLSTVHSAKGLEWSAVLIIDLVEDRFPSRHALVRPEDFEEERRLMYVACTRAKDTLDLFVPLSLYSRSSGGQEPASPSPFVRELPSDTLDEIYENYGGALTRRRIKEAPQPAPAFGGFSVQNRRRSWHWNEDGEDEKPSFRSRRQREDDDWPPRDRDFEPTPRSREDADDAYLAAVRDAVRNGRTLDESPDEKPAKKKLGFCRHRLFGRGKIVEEIPPDKYRVNFPGLGLKIILADYLTLE